MSDLATVASDEPMVSVSMQRIVGMVIERLHVENRQQLAAITTELRALTNDNSVLRQNLALLNTAMGQFQERVAVPLREELKELVHNQGGRVIENQQRLEVLIQALTAALPQSVPLTQARDEQTGLPLDDVRQQIMDGHFADLRHEQANEIAGAEIRGYVRIEQVQAMIERAIDKVLKEPR